jgi:hypothetical protein
MSIGEGADRGMSVGEMIQSKQRWSGSDLLGKNVLEGSGAPEHFLSEISAEILGCAKIYFPSQQCGKVVLDVRHTEEALPSALGRILRARLCRSSVQTHLPAQSRRTRASVCGGACRTPRSPVSRLIFSLFFSLPLPPSHTIRQVSGAGKLSSVSPPCLFPACESSAAACSLNQAGSRISTLGSHE